MSNNKPHNTIKKPADFIKEQNAIQQAKMLDNSAKDASVKPVNADKPASSPTVAETPKEPVDVKQAKIDSIVNTKRKSLDDWNYILDYKDKEGLKDDKALAEVFKVTISNIHQKRNKLKADRANAKAKEEAKLAPVSLADEARKLLEGVDAELKAFDADIQAAKDKVANSKDERAKIEAKTKKYQSIIDLMEE